MSSFEMNDAKRAKKDEFYTMMEDIKKEMTHYGDAFNDKVVYCNCDDPFESNFFKYFVKNFEKLHLKRLIATCFNGKGEIMQRSLFGNAGDDSQSSRHPYKVVIDTVDGFDTAVLDAKDILELTQIEGNSLDTLKGSGDFRSRECLELLDEADVVVTNPPFSLFRDFIEVMFEHRKDFLILGNVNAVTCKEIFSLFKEDRLWFGVSIHSGDREFKVPDDYPLRASGFRQDDEGNKYIRVKGVRWFTNMTNDESSKVLPLTKSYEESSYPKYDGLDAIEVGKTSNIPKDYEGMMGVPITFLDKYNPKQFEIIGLDRYTVPKNVLTEGRLSVDGKICYARILIRKR